MTSMRRFSDSEIRNHVESIAETGVAIVEDAVDAAMLADIRAELERLESVRPGGDVPPAEFTGYVTRRWLDLLNDGEIWQRVAAHPVILAVLPEVLGDGFLLSTMATAIIGPGEAAQPLHVDDLVYAFPRPHPNLVCNTMWAISDFTAANGATLYVPGSNRFEHDPVPGERYPTQSLEMPAGSLAFVVGTTYHAGGRNVTADDRVGLTINYCSGSMRQQENLMLGIRPERMMTFPRELQDILGFRMCKGAGHIFGADPREELERHFGRGEAHDPYMGRRDALHDERTAAKARARQHPAPRRGDHAFTDGTGS